MLSIRNLDLPRLQHKVFVALILLAPFSFVPSIATPLFNFSSFRIGVYQLLAGMFIVLAVLRFLKAKRTKLSPTERLPYSIGIFLILVVLYGLVEAVDKKRGLLMGASVAFLVCTTLAAYSYIRMQKESYFEAIRPLLLKAGILYGMVSLVQLVSALIWPDGSLLCKGCGSGVFGFPRINGFAAEPLFWGNALLPFLFISFASFYKFRDRVSLFALGSVSLAIGLTFSRGAFIAAGLGLVALIALYVKRKQFIVGKVIRTLGVSALGFVLAFLLLVTSAVVAYRDAPYVLYNTARGMIEQLSVGAINLPVKNEVIEPSSVTPVVPEEDFISEGLVETSTSERTDSARLALRAWNNPNNYVFGVGVGNLGPYVVKNIDTGAPSNLTVYIYYVLVLAELGVAGLLALFALYVLALKCLWKVNSEWAMISFACLVAFLVQYAFFGSYINVVYIWVWLGIGMGMGLTSVPSSGQVPEKNLRHK